MRDVRTGAVQRLQWQGPISLQDNQYACFAHDGFAVAGTASNSRVLLWDAKRGDQLLCLDHGGKLRFFFDIDHIDLWYTDCSKVCTLVVRCLYFTMEPHLVTVYGIKFDHRLRVWIKRIAS